MDLLEKHLTKEILHEIDCKTALTKLRTIFKNTFNSELRERLQKLLYTVLNPSKIQGSVTWISLRNDDTFTSTMFLNVDQLQKQLDKDEFQEDRSMAAFWVLNIQFQQLIDSQFTLDYDSQMTNKYFVEYTGIEYDRRVNTRQMHKQESKVDMGKELDADLVDMQRQMQKQESKVDMGKAADADLVVKESSGTESGKQDTSSRSGNDADADNANIRPIYDEEPMAEVQLTAECNVFAIGQQQAEQSELINDGRVD
ncbi:hypothetical protein Tco_0941876 [Tanacetum coccineum]|uniref:Uncharacterized protein n=1 Tax=Tanacetum coccineum TaxID=301880 RepID=A0ABQ5DS55_9ASTR